MLMLLLLLALGQPHWDCVFVVVMAGMTQWQQYVISTLEGEAWLYF
jgi:hypothetical protein